MTTVATTKLKIFWMTLPLIIVGIYNLLTFNKFFPITEGWFSTYATLILSGKIPYKDFYLLLPPLYPLTLAGFIYIFGKTFIALRIFGILLMLIMTGSLYLIFSRFFNYTLSAFITAVCIIYYQSGVAHITYDFTQFLTTYSLLSVYFCIRFYDAQYGPAQKEKITNYTYLCIAGIFSSLAFLTKQSNGAVIFVFIFFAVIISTISINKQAAIKAIFGYLSGFCIPLLCCAIWLKQNGALLDFYQQVFLYAAEVKGSLNRVLFAWARHLFTPDYFIQVFYNIKMLFIPFILGILINKIYTTKNPSAQLTFKHTLINYVLIFIAFILCIFLPFLSMVTLHPKINHFIGIMIQPINNIIGISIAVSIALIVYHTICLFMKKKRSPAIFVSAAAFGFICGNGTSAGLSEVGVFLAIGLFLCYMCSNKYFSLISRPICLLVCLSFIVYLAGNKYAQPYCWWYVPTPDIRQQLYPAHSPLLKGFYLPKDTIMLLDTVHDIIQKNTGPQDEILVFPHTPLFYLLENRTNSLKTIVFWPDFLPDNFAVEAAQKILISPPKAIIYLELPETVWSTHEQLFRDHKLLGERTVMSTINQLTIINKKYTMKATINMAQDVNLKIWIRNY